MDQQLTIKVVESSKDFEAFIRFPFSIYNNNPYWVPPLIKEEIETINPKVNPVYQNADACFYLAYRGKEIVGRIGAMVNWIEVSEVGKKKVRFGWYDTIDDLEVSKLLLQQVENFAKEHQLKSIEGPMGFSNLDKAGLLIEGFKERNTMITLYNAPYYQKHLEALGYGINAKWVEYEIKIDDFEESPEKVKRFSKLVMERYQLKLLQFQSKNDILPYIDEMFDLLGKTYNELQTYVPIQKYQIEHYKKRYIKFIHPDFIKCIVDSEGKLIAFSITMPSFTNALKKINGKINLFNFFYLVNALRKNDRASFYLIGIHPEYQNKGITAIIFNEMQKLFNIRNISIVETNPELEENTAIQKLWKNYEHRLHKKRATFTKDL
ncbi:MAG: GTP cyclohydrolase [Flavobacteriaceae bacterium TMED48]|nr:MAG: GTP cyclohydrolase [Flavobacteriaceae bacterium TMED48]